MIEKGTYFRVLDKGYVGFVDSMGDDFAIERAARTSYQKGTRKVNETRGLLRYLKRHHHTTPFEMAELVFHVKVPMDCWRQWIRHRTASVNEYSTRYSEAIDECQQTKPEEWRLQSKSNKQGSSGFLPNTFEGYPEGFEFWDDPSTVIDAGDYLSMREHNLIASIKGIYEERIKFGVAREQARKDLPLSNYTIAFWKIDLHNLFNFLRLRMDSHAQLEIREYANVIGGVVKELFPLSWEAFVDYNLEAVSFSRLDRLLLDKYIKTYGQFDDMETVLRIITDYAKNDLQISEREYHEFIEKMSIPSPRDYSLDYSKQIEAPQ